MVFGGADRHIIGLYHGEHILGICIDQVGRFIYINPPSALIFGLGNIPAMQKGLPVNLLCFASQ